MLSKIVAWYVSNKKKYIESELMNTYKTFYIIIIDSQTVKEKFSTFDTIGGGVKNWLKIANFGGNHDHLF